MRYVVIGASASGISGAKTLREQDPTGEIILISKDETIYSRCILHHFMQGIRTVETMNFVEKDFFEKYNIQWMKGISVVDVDTKNRCVKTEDGQSIPYDKLLIASGANTKMLPIENMNSAKGIIGFRNLNDCISILEKAKTAKHIVVLGGGLVGIDAVSGLIHGGNKVTLIETKSHLLPLQLDDYAAQIYEEKFKENGVEQRYRTKVCKVIMDDCENLTHLQLENEEQIPCDLLIIATSVAANLSFLKNSPILCDEYGLVIDATGKTNVDHVYGAGDVTGKSPIWPAAVKEGIVAAENMTGHKRSMTDFFASKCTMNFLSIPTMSLGMVEPIDDSFHVEVQITKNGYKKIINKDGKIYGAILQGDLSYSGILTQLIKENIDVSKVKKPLFEIDYSDFFHISKNLDFSF